MNLNYLKMNHNNSILKLLQKHKEIFDGTLCKYKGSDIAVSITTLAFCKRK